MYNPKAQGSIIGGSSMERPTCAMCGKKHDSNYLVCIDRYYSCGKRSNMIKDCLIFKDNGREGKQVHPRG